MSQQRVELTIARHWEMLRLLPSRRPGITTAELESQLKSNGFKVDRRTIQRDLQSLSGIFPLECNDKSKPYGWFWMPEFRKELPGFSVPEALSLSLIEDYMKSLLPISIATVLEPQFKQARAKLDSIKMENKKASWLEKVRVVAPTMPMVPPKIAPQVLELVQDALIDEVQVKVEYSKPQSKQLSCWVLHPLGLVQRGSVSYLVCTMFDYSDIRLCALHRIVSAELLDEPAKRPKQFNLDRYIAEGSLHFGGGKEIKLEANIDPTLLEFLKETPLSEDMKIISNNEEHKIKATVNTSWQLHWWILSQGNHLEILKPVSLRKLIKQELEKALEQYQE